MIDYKAEYNRWLEHVAEDQVLEELRGMDDAAIEDAFYQVLSFGTGGLRGIMGAGTNRMNRCTVQKASQGLANYMNAHYENPRIAISYDSRVNSEDFAKTASSVFAANGIKVYVYAELMPTPCLSFAVRELGCSAGIMITASHNPAEYNGYKVYGPDGCQITTETAGKILTEIEKLDVFTDVRRISWESAKMQGALEIIPDKIYDRFTEKVKKQSVLFEDKIDRKIAIVYTPLNGTGLKPVTRVLEESGFTNITVVEEQKNPDGNFPTCPYPNPEIREAMELGLEYCSRVNADLLLATDPDADRCGIAVKTETNDYRLLSGNEVGLLLLDFICSQRIKHGKMPAAPVFVKTIATVDLAEKIAESYGVRTVNVLTGFKFIGEVIGKLESEGREKDYICGFEESYGYLTGVYVRDKDGVNAAFMIAEMFAYYKTKGISLPDKLNELYDKYGYCRNTLHGYEFEGSAGMDRMREIMKAFRKGIGNIGGYKVIRTEDYYTGLNGLPPSDVLKFFFKDTAGKNTAAGKTEVTGSVVVRPSGTEPKLKIYISVTAKSEKRAREAEEQIIRNFLYGK